MLDAHVAYCRRVEDHRVQILRMLEKRMHPAVRARFDAEDVLSLVTVKCPPNVHQLLMLPRTRFYYWLRQVARHRLVELQRYHLDSGCRDPRRELPNQSTDSAESQRLNAMMDLGPTQVETAELQELCAWVNRSLEALSPGDREILRLRYYDDLEPNEIAARIGISLVNCQKRVHRARLRLKRLLETTA